MPLHPGTRLGPYEIVHPLGAGGMGEVYRARDTRLNRDVAIKVLPELFASDAERLSRFEREAQVLASFNHPHIAQVYGVIDAPAALVMELVEGEDVSQRIARGAIPVREALEIARQIADALAAAHEKGIVHRDLKPANIKLREDGAVKVLDFGLAKLIAPDAGSSGAIMNSPTFTAPPTQLGVILGTAAYMAPEQAKGKAVDKRADIWAFGVILFEMLSGRRLFEGDAISEVLASVLKEEPRWTHLPPDTPASIRRLLARCLQKDPKRRLHDIGDARIELDDSGEEAAPAAGRRPFGLAVIMAAAVAGAAITGIAWVFWALQSPANPSPQIRRLTVLPPAGHELFRDSSEHALSPDGRMIVFNAGDYAPGDEDRRLWLRSLDASSPRPLPGTEGGILPFWSPDSRHIAFFAKRKLTLISLDNLAVTVVCEALDGRGGTWSRSGPIVFAASNAGPLMRVAASGGEPQAVTTIDSSKGETGHRFPWFLPDGRHFLFAALPAREGRFDIYVASTDAGDRKLLLSAASAPAYVDPGYLVFARNNVLVAQPFDPRRRETTGEVVTLGDTPADVGSEWLGGRAAAASANGVLAYLSADVSNTRLVWLDPDTGRETGAIAVPPGMYRDLRVSPDGKRAVAVRPAVGAASDIWVIDLERGGATPLTSGPGLKEFPAWSPDSSRIAFSNNRTGPQNIHVVSAAGTSPEEPLFTSADMFKSVTSWSADGRYIVFAQLEPDTANDLWVLSVDGDRKPRLYLRTRADEIAGEISPDGKWMAYRSDETGTPELYVQSFPTPGQKYPITTAGASGWGEWLNGGRQLGYFGSVGPVLVDILPGPPFRVSPPRPFGKAKPPKGIISGALTPDMKRVLASMSVEGGVPASITVILDWAAALRKN